MRWHATTRSRRRCKMVRNRGLNVVCKQRRVKIGPPVKFRSEVIGAADKLPRAVAPDPNELGTVDQA
jgi:hypothetical protein